MALVKQVIRNSLGAYETRYYDDGTPGYGVENYALGTYSGEGYLDGGYGDNAYAESDVYYDPENPASVASLETGVIEGDKGSAFTPTIPGQGTSASDIASQTPSTTDFSRTPANNFGYTDLSGVKTGMKAAGVLGAPVAPLGAVLGVVNNIDNTKAVNAARAALGIQTQVGGVKGALMGPEKGKVGTVAIGDQVFDVSLNPKDVNSVTPAQALDMAEQQGVGIREATPEEKAAQAEAQAARKSDESLMDKAKNAVGLGKKAEDSTPTVTQAQAAPAEVSAAQVSAPSVSTPSVSAPEQDLSTPGYNPSPSNDVADVGTTSPSSAGTQTASLGAGPTSAVSPSVERTTPAMDKVDPSVPDTPASAIGNAARAKGADESVASLLDKMSQKAPDAMSKASVNSAQRTAAENKAVGGAKNSQHLGKQAVDIDTSKMTAKERSAVTKAALDSGVKGMGIYGGPQKGMHVDSRQKAAAWGPSHSKSSLALGMKRSQIDPAVQKEVGLLAKGVNPVPSQPPTPTPSPLNPLDVQIAMTPVDQMAPAQATPAQTVDATPVGPDETLSEVSPTDVSVASPADVASSFSPTEVSPADVGAVAQAMSAPSDVASMAPTEVGAIEAASKQNSVSPSASSIGSPSSMSTPSSIGSPSATNNASSPTNLGSVSTPSASTAGSFTGSMTPSSATSAGIGAQRTAADNKAMGQALAGELGPGALGRLSKDDPAAQKEAASILGTIDNRSMSARNAATPNPAASATYSPSQYSAFNPGMRATTARNYSITKETVQKAVDDYNAGKIKSVDPTATHYANLDVANPAWSKDVDVDVGQHTFGTTPSRETAKTKDTFGTGWGPTSANSVTGPTGAPASPASTYGSAANPTGVGRVDTMSMSPTSAQSPSNMMDKTGYNPTGSYVDTADPARTGPQQTNPSLGQIGATPTGPSPSMGSIGTTPGALGSLGVNPGSMSTQSAAAAQSSVSPSTASPSSLGNLGTPGSQFGGLGATPGASSPSSSPSVGDLARSSDVSVSADRATSSAEAASAAADASSASSADSSSDSSSDSSGGSGGERGGGLGSEKSEKSEKSENGGAGGGQSR